MSLVRQALRPKHELRRLAPRKARKDPNPRPASGEGLVAWFQTLWAIFNRLDYFRARPLDVWLAMLWLPMLPTFSVFRCDDAVVGLLPSSGRSRCQSS